MQFEVQMPAMNDPHEVPDIFASGLGEIEDAGGGCFRFTLFAQKRDHCIVVARIVVPASALPLILYLAGRTVGLSLVRAATERSGPVN